MRDMYHMQQNIKECLIILAEIRLRKIRKKKMHRWKTIRILNSTVKISLIIADMRVFESSYFIQCKKGHFAPFNSVIGVINLELHLYAKLETFSS